MKTKIMIVNAAILFVLCSLYFGTGWSLYLFSFPVAPQLTVDNYYLQFVPQINEATRVLTVVTYIMIVSGAILIWYEWKTPYKWWPIITVACVMLAGWITKEYIFPYNDQMRAHITDPAVLKHVLDQFIYLSTIRVAIWSVEWLAMMIYFGLLAYRYKQGQMVKPVSAAISETSDATSKEENEPCTTTAH